MSLTWRVLIAEDNPDDVELELLEFRRAGMRVTHRVADCAEAFVTALRSFAPDVILWTFHAKFRRRGSAQADARNCAGDAFIFVRARSARTMRSRALKIGATDYG